MRDLSLHILDIVQNSVAAKARLVKISLELEGKKGMLQLKIADDGIGMDEDTLVRVKDPFWTTRTTRKVGLGIPLMGEAAKRCDGHMTIKSRLGEGTCIEAGFFKDHIDMPPLGSIAETMVSLVATSPDTDFVLLYIKGGDRLSFDTREVKHKLQGVPISHPEVLDWIKHYIEQLQEKFYGGA